MADKPTVSIVGAGNLGTALAISLQRAGFTIDSVIGDRTAGSQKKAMGLARKVGARSRTDLKASKAKVIWLCVPDSRIAEASEALSKQIAKVRGVIALHSSGALTSGALDPFRAKGIAVASVHPLMTFVRGSRPSLAEAPFAIEGDRAAVRISRRIVRDLGGKAFAIGEKHKAAYHAWGAFVSPLFTALLATSERVASLAGVKEKEARKRALPILLQTLANYASFGPAGAFSGPIIRGDVETVRKHLIVLRGDPVAYEVYTALVRAALQYLPSRNKRELKRLLDALR